MADTHYTAVIDVQKVTVTPSTTRVGGYPSHTEIVPETRDVTEVTKLVVRAETLERLTQKITAYAELIEEA